MANTKALRHQIQSQIAALQEKLRAIDMVDRMSQELKAKGKPKALAASAAGVVNSDSSLIGVCLSVLTDQWQPVRALAALVEARRPGSAASAVSVAYQRLFKRGFAEKRGGESRKDVSEYRRKHL